MKTVKGMPITGTNTQTSKKKPLVPNAADTSANEQTMIAEAPTPFKNNMTTPQMPVGTKASGGVSTLEPRIQSGLQRTTPGARALPPRGPIGQRKAINQSGQVNGRMGTSFPRRKGQNGQGYPIKGNARFYGE